MSYSLSRIIIMTSRKSRKECDKKIWEKMTATVNGANTIENFLLHKSSAQCNPVA